MTYLDFDRYGHPRRFLADLHKIQEMSSPVRCVCGQVYDLGTVTVTARYTDCSMWKAPCCKRVADDRYATCWTNLRHYYELDRETGREKGGRR